MAKKISPQKPSAVRHGLLEYLILGLLTLVVVVTAWTLYDNGILDTFTDFVRLNP